MCPRDTCKLLTLLKLCGTPHWAHVSNIFVLYQTLCCDTSFMSSTNVAITGPDCFLPNGKHSLSSLNRDLSHSTVGKIPVPVLNHTSPQSLQAIKKFSPAFFLA